MGQDKIMAQRGSVTIFLSLSLLLIISFVSTALQSARMAGSRYLFLLASESVVTSMSGAFDTNLWQQYRVLGLSDVERADRIGRDCGKVYEREEGLFRITLDSWQIAEQITLADQGADGWRQSVTAYMEKEIPANLMSELWEKTGMAEKLSDYAERYQDIRSVMEPVIELEQQIREVEKQYSHGLELLQNSRKLASQMEELIAEMENWRFDETEMENADSPGQGGTDQQQRIQEALNVMRQCKEELEQLLGTKSGLSSVLDQANRIIANAQALQGQLSQVIGRLEGVKEASYLSVLSDFGGYGQQLALRIENLAAMPESIQQLIRKGQEAEKLRIPSLEEMISGDGIWQLSQWKSFLGELGGLHLEEGAEILTEGSDSDRKSLLDYRNLKEWLSDGFLGILLPEYSQISDRRIARVFVRSGPPEDRDWPEQAYENLLYGEYALRYTAHWGEDGKEGLQYETEYLIAGNPSDRENLSEVALSLLGIRGAANLAYLLQDSASRSQAETAAGGISAALGGWLPVGVATIFLLALWAAAEAVCDVRGLLQEKKIPLWKTAETWTVSWDQLWKLSGTGLPEGTWYGEAAEGMDYEAYLRILLYLTPLQDKCYRTMEAAEENLQASDSGLKLDQTIYRATWNIQGKAAGQPCELSLTYGY